MVLSVYFKQNFKCLLFWSLPYLLMTRSCPGMLGFQKAWSHKPPWFACPSTIFLLFLKILSLSLVDGISKNVLFSALNQVDCQTTSFMTCKCSGQACVHIKNHFQFLSLSFQKMWNDFVKKQWFWWVGMGVSMSENFVKFHFSVGNLLKHHLCAPSMNYRQIGLTSPTYLRFRNRLRLWCLNETLQFCQICTYLE